MIRFQRIRWARVLVMVLVLTPFGWIASSCVLSAPPTTVIAQPGTMMKVALSGGTYVEPEQPAPAPAPNDDRLKKMEKRIEELHDKLDKILKAIDEESGDSPKPEDSPVSAAGQKNLELALKTCLGCHNERDAFKKGNKRILFRYEKDPSTGKDIAKFRDDFDKREMNLILFEVKEGTMPKKTSGKVLTPEQKAALMEEMSARLSRVE